MHTNCTQIVKNEDNQGFSFHIYTESICSLPLICTWFWCLSALLPWFYKRQTRIRILILWYARNTHTHILMLWYITNISAI